MGKRGELLGPGSRGGAASWLKWRQARDRKLVKGPRRSKLVEKIATAKAADTEAKP